MAALGASGRAGRWDAPRARDPALARGRSGRRGGPDLRARGRVLGARRAANAGAVLGPPRLGARDELHAEKGLLQAGRQQDCLGAAQDLRVPDARRQRGVWRCVVRPPGQRAAGGRRGARGASGGTYSGRAGTGAQMEPPDDPGPASAPLPGLASGVGEGPRLLGGARGCAPTTLSEDPKAPSPAGSEDSGGGFSELSAWSWEAATGQRSGSQKPQAVAEADLRPPRAPLHCPHRLCGVSVA